METNRLAVGTRWMAACAALEIGAGVAGAQGSTFLASRASDGAPAGSYSGSASTSADGRYVAFSADGVGFVPGDTNDATDVYVHDRLTGTTVRVSVASDGTQADGPSSDPRISGDGRFVAFSSVAATLVSGDTNGRTDIFVHDLQVHTTERITRAWDGGQTNERSGQPALSHDGRYVVFDSFATNLVPVDANGFMADVFVHDRLLGATTLASVSTGGVQTNGPCQSASISGDGRLVAFASGATNLVPGDSNGQADVFVRDLLLGTTIAASWTGAGVGGNAESTSPALSGDGRFVAFTSLASNLVPDDTNGAGDIFVFELATGTATRASLTASGTQSAGGSFSPTISDDGGRVAFVAGDADFAPGDTNGFVDVFLRDRVAGTTELVSQNTQGVQGVDFSTFPLVSGDGRYVAFESPADNLVEMPTTGSRNVFVRDTLGCSPTIASFCTGGTTTNGCQPWISASGIPSASAGSGFTITVNAVEGQKVGIVFYGTTGPALAPFGGGSGILCVHSPFQRTGIRSSGGTHGACDGQFVLDWNQFASTHPIAVGVPFLGGETVWVQAWFRDPLAPGGSNLSGGLWFDVCR